MTRASSHQLKSGIDGSHLSTRASLLSRSLDCLLSNPKYGGKALSKNLVKQTWQEVLGDKDNLPKDWTKGAGVLVSMRAGVG